MFSHDKHFLTVQQPFLGPGLQQLGFLQSEPTCPAASDYSSYKEIKQVGPELQLEADGEQLPVNQFMVLCFINNQCSEK